MKATTEMPPRSLTCVKAWNHRLNVLPRQQCGKTVVEIHQGRANENETQFIHVEGSVTYTHTHTHTHTLISVRSGVRATRRGAFDDSHSSQQLLLGGD